MSGNESRYEKLHIVKKPNAISRSQRGSETSTHWFAGNFDEPFDWSIFSRFTALGLDAFQPVTSDIDILVITGYIVTHNDHAARNDAFPP